MIKKARTYFFIIAACLLLGMLITYLKAMGAQDGINWLCSGRYIVDEGFVVYDYWLAGWLVADAILISGAYFAIPALITKVRQDRDDITEPVDQTLMKFTVFIVMCGIGHLVDAINIHLHYYYMVAGWHLATGIVSIDTFLSLRRAAPYFLSMPSRSYFQSFVEVSNQMQAQFNTGFWWYDIETASVKWSEGAKRIYGKPTTWVVDLETVDAMVTDESRPDYEAETSRHRVHGGDTSFTYQINVEGKIKTIRADIYHREGENGKPGLLYGSLQDVGASAVGADEVIASTANMGRKATYAHLSAAATTLQQQINTMRLDNHK